MTGGGGASRGIYGRGCAQPVSISESLAALVLRVVRPEPSPLRLSPQRAESLCRLGTPLLLGGAPHLPHPQGPSCISSAVRWFWGLSVCFLLFPLCCSKTGLSEAPHSEGSSTSGERRLRRTHRPHLRTGEGQRAGAPSRLPPPPPAFVRSSAWEARRAFIDAPIPVV